MKHSLRLAFVVPLLLSGMLAAQEPLDPPTVQGQAPIPDPSGPFDVGRLEIDVTDASRPEEFTDDRSDTRRLLVTVYYPAVAGEGAQRVTYGTPELAAASSFFDDERRGWLAPLYEDVAVAEGRFPVLVFSPGLGSLTLYYTSLLSELASRGFVIAALWHPYSTEVVAFPDGTVLRGNPDGGTLETPADEQAEKLARIGEVWVADQRFVLDQMTEWNEQHDLLRGRLDLRHIGALGHSLGGAAAVETARVDERIDAAINMDGAMFGDVVTLGSRVPFLLFHSDIPVPADAELQQLGLTREQADAMLKSIMDERATILARSPHASAETLDGARHEAFMTDFLYFSTAMPAEIRSALVGDVDPAAAFGDISRWIVEFMSEHLAQPTSEQARAALIRDAESFADCTMRRDLACVAELENRNIYEETDWLISEYDALRRRLLVGSSAFPPNYARDYTWMEVAEPWPPIAVGDALYAFVPYFATFGDVWRGRREERVAYLIGASENGGTSWRFFGVRSELSSKEIDRLIPGHGETPRPEVSDFEFKESPFQASRWLETAERRFIPVNEGYVYALTFAVVRNVEGPIDISVSYDDPANPGRTLRFVGSLEAGQDALQWQSPSLGGFESGTTYEVLVEGSDPIDGSLVLEHSEELLFESARELWLSELSRAPEP